MSAQRRQQQEKLAEKAIEEARQKQAELAAASAITNGTVSQPGESLKKVIKKLCIFSFSNSLYNPNLSIVFDPMLKC